MISMAWSWGKETSDWIRRGTWLGRARLIFQGLKRKIFLMPTVVDKKIWVWCNRCMDLELMPCSIFSRVTIAVNKDNLKVHSAKAQEWVHLWWWLKNLTILLKLLTKKTIISRLIMVTSLPKLNSLNLLRQMGYLKSWNLHKFKPTDRQVMQGFYLGMCMTSGSRKLIRRIPSVSSIPKGMISWIHSHQPRICLQRKALLITWIQRMNQVRWWTRLSIS